MLNTLEFLKERERDLIIQRNTIERDLQYVSRLIYISEGSSDDSNFKNKLNRFLESEEFNWCKWYYVWLVLL